LPSWLHIKEDTIMSGFYFGGDFFSEFDRLQRQMSSLFGVCLQRPLRPVQSLPRSEYR
jgi:hypothetical protein